MKELTKRMNERINQLPIEVYRAWIYTLLFVVMLQIDALHCQYLNRFYGTTDYFLTHMRGWIAISASLLFGIIDFCIAKKMIEYANKIYFRIIITITNGIPSDIQIEGITRILKYVGYYFLGVSICSIAYDCYEILFVHLLKIGPF